MTVTPDGQEGSLLPPSQRDLLRGEDFVRAHSRNLRALGQGFPGRLVTPRAVVGTADSEDDSVVGDDGNPADDTQYEWEWNDRYTVVAATGDQVARLTYVPVEESLFVFWHPSGGGGLPITNEHFTLVDNVVTLFDPGILAVGDEFSFQYMFDPGIIPEPPTDVVVRGTTGADSSDTVIDIPTGTLAGDTLILSYSSPFTVVSDPRFPDPPIYSDVSFIPRYILVGTADGSGLGVPISLNGGLIGTIGFATMTALSPCTVGTPVTQTDTSYPASLPAASAVQALAALFASYSVVPGQVTVDGDGDWTRLGQSGSGWSVTHDFWTNPTDLVSSTPPGSYGYTGFSTALYVAVLPVTGV